MISKASDLKVQGRHSREEGRGQQGRTPANTKQPRADQPDQTQTRKESPRGHQTRQAKHHTGRQGRVKEGRKRHQGKTARQQGSWHARSAKETHHSPRYQTSRRERRGTPRPNRNSRLEVTGGGQQCHISKLQGHRHSLVGCVDHPCSLEGISITVD